MAQHDYVIDNASGASVRSDLNLALSAVVSLNSGASAPSPTFAYMLWSDTTNGVLKRRNAANSAWVNCGPLAAMMVQAKSGSYTAVPGDFGTLFDCTGTWTLALTAASSMGDGHIFGVRNSGTGVITIDPDSSETIDGASTIAANPGDSFIVICTGTLFRTIGRGLPVGGGSLQGAINEAKGASIASAATTSIWATDGNTVHITGTTAITSFGIAPQAGAARKLVFDGALTLTNGSNLILPGGANITTAAGDSCEVAAETTTQHRVVRYTKANGQAVISAASVSAATQAEMEAASSTSAFSSPGRQKNHPAHPKAWVKITNSGAAAISQSHGVSSVVDNGTGDVTINFSTSFAAATYGYLGTACERAGGHEMIVMQSSSVSPAVGSCRMTTRGGGGGTADVDFTVAFFGDQ